MDAREQLLLLWRHRWPILVVAAALGALAAGFSLARTRVFEAGATVSVSASRLNDQMPAPVSPENYVPLMHTQAVAAKVIADLKLDGATPSGLLDNDVTVRAVPNTNLIRVVARLDTPERAAAVANRFAEEAVVAATKASRIDVETIERDLRQMLDAATARLRAAEQAYDGYRITARFEMVEREVETLVGQRSDLMEVVVDLEGERARLARLESDLSSLTPVTPLRQAVVDEPVLGEAARAAGANTRDLLSLEMTREAPNAVYASLKEEASKTRAHVAFLEQRRQRLTASAGLEGSQLARMTQLYERESMLARLDSELTIARKSYEDIAARYQGTRLAAIGRAPQLLIVDPAIAPDRPMSRYLARNLLLGVTAGLLLGCVGVLLREALAAPRRA
jgi:polysaccharide biosynthesis transport protein